ncbi:hypothetical protein GTY65_16185 [Streptomyces sp. SID8379]|uniref:hypothetical protein n=1 Tax=unclassified Streptomyces TaxID=2593676 RepID=UPI001319CF4C|nr:MULTISPECIES: hypothetical protein [unclassified Streptomyces]MYW65584.1 hypothetical protein [Streptomyces sp. SID8379]
MTPIRIIDHDLPDGYLAKHLTSPATAGVLHITSRPSCAAGRAGSRRPWTKRTGPGGRRCWRGAGLARGPVGAAAPFT